MYLARHSQGVVEYNVRASMYSTQYSQSFLNIVETTCFKQAFAKEYKWPGLNSSSDLRTKVNAFSKDVHDHVIAKAE